MPTSCVVWGHTHGELVEGCFWEDQTHGELDEDAGSLAEVEGIEGADERFETREAGELEERHQRGQERMLPARLYELGEGRWGRC